MALVLVGSSGSHNTLLSVGALPIGASRMDWVTLHQVTFVVWAVATGLHLLGRFVPALRRTFVPAASTGLVPGARSRVALILVTGVAAFATSLLVLSAAGSWQRGDDRPEGVGVMVPASI